MGSWMLDGRTCGTPRSAGRLANEAGRLEAAGPMKASAVLTNKAGWLTIPIAAMVIRVIHTSFFISAISLVRRRPAEAGRLCSLFSCDHYEVLGASGRPANRARYRMNLG